MRRVVLDMQCSMFSEAISQALMRSDPDFMVCRAETPSNTVQLCRSMAAYAVIMEVTGYPPWRLSERLALRDKIRQQIPACKVVLLVDEMADAALAAAVRQAKKDGLVDNFIYGSVSPDYLVAVMDTL